REANPEHWFIVDDIPRNARGKVNRDAIYRVLVKDVRDTPRAVGRCSAAVAETTTEAADRSTSAGRVREAVKRAWISVLLPTSFAADAQWEKAGGDSLNSLRFWFHLESALGAPLPLDILKPDATPDMICSTIAKHLIVDRDASGQGAPLVFLMPSDHGGLPGLVRFLAACAGAIRFVTIRYPSWRVMIDAGNGFDVMVDCAVAQVLGHCDDDIYLAGTSFGGFVAWETARRLMESGRRVRFVGLIDTRRDNLLELHEGLRVKVGKVLRLIFSRQRSTSTVMLESLFRSLS